MFFVSLICIVSPSCVRLWIGGECFMRLVGVSVIHVWAAFWCLIYLYENRDAKSLQWFLLTWFFCGGLGCASLWILVWSEKSIFLWLCIFLSLFFAVSAWLQCFKLRLSLILWKTADKCGLQLWLWRLQKCCDRNCGSEAFLNLVWLHLFIFFGFVFFI